MTPLRKRYIEDIELRNLSEHTQRAYVRAVAQFAEFFGKSPELLGREEIRKYLLYLIREKRVCGSTYRQVLSAIRLLYRTTLGKDWAVEGIQHRKSEKKLPLVMSMDEVDQFFQSLDSLKYRAILMTAYAAGLRVSEVVSLRVTDIDSARMVIRITNATLKPLALLPHPEMLLLNGTDITDEGLKHLHGLKSLRTLFLRGTKVTDAGVAGFQKALPNCVTYR